MGNKARGPFPSTDCMTSQAIPDHALFEVETPTVGQSRDRGHQESDFRVYAPTLYSRTMLQLDSARVNGIVRSVKSTSRVPEF